MTPQELEVALNSVDEVLNKGNPNTEVIFLHAAILQHRGNYKPSKEEMTISHNIANGMIWGYKLAKLHPEFSLADVAAYSEELATKIESEAETLSNDNNKKVG